MDLVRDRVSLERKNLAMVCSLSVKTLIDKSCYMTLDEQSEEFLNFSIILEHVFNHRFKPRVTWYRGKDMKGVWDYVKLACKPLPDNCLKNLSNFEHIKTGHGKVRAWVRVALMEKRLSEYISSAISQADLTRQFYGEGALLLSEDADLLTKSLLGLNAIDFSFDLKSADLDMPGCTVIDYSPYLSFTQCPQSVVEDARELRSLSISSKDEPVTSAAGAEDLTSERGSPDGKAPDTPQNTPNPVSQTNQTDDTVSCTHVQYRTLVEQKGYLEELLRLRDRQLRADREEKNLLLARLERFEALKARDMHQLETVVIELQAQLQTLKNDYHRLQRHVILASQGRRSSVPRFRYSTADQRVHGSFSEESDTLIPTADEAATLLPPEASASRRSPSQEIDCDLQVVGASPHSAGSGAQILSSSADSADLQSVTMHVEAEIHRNSESDRETSPVAELLAVQKGFYNLGGDVDRESSEERNLRGSSEERNQRGSSEERQEPSSQIDNTPRENTTYQLHSTHAVEDALNGNELRGGDTVGNDVKDENSNQPATSTKPANSDQLNELENTPVAS